MREQERRRRSPDPAAKGKGKSKKKAVEDDGEEEEEGDDEDEAEPVLQSDDVSSLTPPPAKRPRKGKEPAKEPATPNSKESRLKATAPTADSSKSKRTRTRSRATIHAPPPPVPGPVLHLEPVIDPQLEEYDAIAQAGYPEMEMQHIGYSLLPPEPDQLQAVPGWGFDPDLDALARAYIHDHE